MKEKNEQIRLKKKIERLAVEPVLKQLQLKNPELKDNERPDFKLSYNNLNIGIEVVSYIPASHKDENALEKILQEYAKLLDSRTEKRYFISVLPKFGFVQHIDYKENKTKIFRELNGFYSKTLTDEHSTYFDDVSFDEVDSSVCTSCTKSVALLYGYQEYNDVQHSILFPLIEDKEKKLDKYKELNADINEYWLIIFVPYSSKIDIRNGIKPPKEFRSSYNRIYLTDEAECILYYQDNRVLL